MNTLGIYDDKIRRYVKYQVGRIRKKCLDRRNPEGFALTFLRKPPSKKVALFTEQIVLRAVGKSSEVVFFIFLLGGFYL